MAREQILTGVSLAAVCPSFRRSVFSLQRPSLHIGRPDISALLISSGCV